MEDYLRQLSSLVKPTWDSLINVADIVLVAFINYQIFKLIQTARAWRVFLGIVGFVVLLFAAKVLKFGALYLMLDKATLLGPVALVILFFPELRQVLERVGSIVPPLVDSTTEARTIEELVAAMTELSSQSMGALLVIERGAPLTDIVSNGVEIDAKVSAPLLSSIFYEKNALHDGAAIIRGDKVVAAACRLPLSENPNLDKNVHMRHRAAVGVSEATDCLVLVVSEERGTMSMAFEGRLERIPTVKDLRERLNHELRGEEMGERPKKSKVKRAQEEVAS